MLRRQKRSRGRSGGKRGRKVIIGVAVGEDIEGGHRATNRWGRLDGSKNKKEIKMAGANGVKANSKKMSG